jgi:hypothetical protein
MYITDTLDLAIKQKEIGTTDGAYRVTHNGKVLEKAAYMTNDAWCTFLGAMSEAAKEEYAAGGGDELSEKNGRPPKMASYGSSSRLIYNLSHKKEGFRFEKKLPTTVGGTANLDGFFEDENRYIFVEAKCHEPYTAKKSAVSKSYAALYDYINTHMSGAVQIDAKESKCGRYLDANYFAEGEKLLHFDMKQMICHLLGIATGVLKGTLAHKQIDFIYLLYDPTELEIEDKAKAAIDSIHEKICYECNLVDFSSLLRVIFEFLRENYYSNAITDEALESLLCRFTFTLASQEFYPLLIQ